MAKCKVKKSATVTLRLSEAEAVYVWGALMNTNPTDEAREAGAGTVGTEDDPVFGALSDALEAAGVVRTYGYAEALA